MTTTKTMTVVERFIYDLSQYPDGYGKILIPDEKTLKDVKEALTECYGEFVKYQGFIPDKYPFVLAGREHEAHPTEISGSISKNDTAFIMAISRSDFDHLLQLPDLSDRPEPSEGYSLLELLDIDPMRLDELTEMVTSYVERRKNRDSLFMSGLIAIADSDSEVVAVLNIFNTITY